MLLAAGAFSTAAQDRLSDKDVANMMNNLKNDAEKFPPVWNHALSKSTIRKTSREKDARNLATQFQNQTEGMLRQFQSNKTADTSLPLVQQTARNIEQVKSDVSLGPVVDQQWTKIRTELDQIAKPSNFLRTEAPGLMLHDLIRETRRTNHANFWNHRDPVRYNYSSQ